MKKIFIGLFLLIFFCSFAQNSYAITQTSGDLQITYVDPLFSSSTIWYPGLIETKLLSVKNLGTSTHKTQILAGSTSQTGELANNLLLQIADGVFNVYGGGSKTLNDFWNQGTVNLTDVNAGNTKNYYFTVTMPKELGNKFQNTQAKFDLTVGFEGTTSNVTVSGGGGAVVGAATTVCNNQKPGAAPYLLTAISGNNSVTLHWNKASDPVSYYLVAYGVSPNNNSYGNPYVGDQNTTSYMVNGLSGGTQYCFIVRAGNGCTPGDFSNQICTTPVGGFVAAVTAPGFAPGVLGVSTPEAKIAGQIKGAETVNIPNCRNCLWWQILLVEFIALLIYFVIQLRKYSLKKIIAVGGIIPILTYLIFLILNRLCITKLFFDSSQNFICKYFIIFNIALYVIVAFFYKKRYSSEVE